MAKTETADKDAERKKEEFQSKYMELQMIDRHMKRIQQQIEMLQKQGEELEQTRMNIDEMHKVKPNTPILVPIASGIFAKATITQTDELIVNAGADTAVAKDIAGVQRILSDQLTEIKELETELAGQLTQLTEKTEQLNEALRALIA